MTLHFDIEKVRAEVISLIAGHPELAEDAILREDMLAGSSDMGEVMDRIAMQITETELQAKANNQAAQIYEAREARFERAADALRGLAAKLLDQAGLERWRGNFGTFFFSNRKPKPVVLNPDALPDECVKITRAANVVAIKDYIEKNGGRLPAGVAMSNGGRNISFRK